MNINQQSNNILGLGIAVFLTVISGTRADSVTQYEPEFRANFQSEEKIPGNILPETSFSLIKNEIGDFIHLKINDKGELAFDRGAWEISKPANMKARLSEIQKDLKTRYPNMSENFLSERAVEVLNNEKGDVDPVVVAFKGFRQKRLTGGGGSGNDGEPTSRSWYFRTNTVFCRLTLKQLNEISIRIADLSEALAPGVISLTENGNGDFSAFIFLGENGPFLTMMQTAEKEFSLDLFQNGSVSTRTAKSFEALLTKDEPYLQEYIFPILAQVGIQPPVNRKPSKKL